MSGTSVTLTKVNVYGEFYQLDGTTPKTGTVTITVPVTVKDVTDKVIFPVGDSKSFALDSFGQFSQNLIANDDPGLFPTGSWTYLVSIAFTDSPTLTFPLTVPISAVSAGVNLVDVISTSSPTDQPAVLIRGVANGVAGLDSAGLVINADGSHPSSGGGAVSSVAGKTGTVALVAADVSGVATAAALTSETSRATTAEGLAAAKTANLSDLASAATARANLGLGTSAVMPVLIPTSVQTSAYTAVAGDLARADATSGPLTVTLPASAPAGAVVAVKKMDLSTNAVSVALSGSDTIDGVSGPVALPLGQYTVRVYRKDSGTTWVVESGLLTSSYLASTFAGIDVSGLVVTTAMRPFNIRGVVAGSTTYNPWDVVIYRGRRILVKNTFTTAAGSTPFVSASNYVTLASQGVFFAEDWGFVCDGLQSSAAANSAALAAVCSYINGTNTNGVGGTIMLPAGSPYLSSPCTLPIGVEVEAQGKFGTYVSMADGSNCHAFVTRPGTGGGTANAFFSGVRRVGIDCRGSAQGNVKFTDGAITSGSPNITSTSHTFTNGEPLVGVGIPSGTTVSSGGGTGSAVMSANATATTTGLTVVVPFFADGVLTAGSSAISSTTHAFTNGEYITGTGVQPGTVVANASGGTATLVQQLAASVTLSTTGATIKLGNSAVTQQLGANTLGMAVSGTVLVFPTIGAAPVTVTYTGKTYATYTGCTIASGTQALTASSYVGVAAQQTLAAAKLYTAAGQYHGIYHTTNPVSTAATGDWGFDPTHRFEDVYIKNAHDDGIHIDGRSDIVVSRCKVSVAGGVAFKSSFDTHFSDCASDFPGYAGFYYTNSSAQTVGCKSYNAGQFLTTAGAASNAGYGFVAASSGLSELAFAGCDAQQNNGANWALIGTDNPIYGVSIAGCNSYQSSFGNGTTYAGLHLENAKSCVISLTNGNTVAAPALRLIGGSDKNSITISNYASTGVTGLDITADSATLTNHVMINGAFLSPAVELQANKGQPSGYPPLNSGGTIDPAFLPSASTGAQFGNGFFGDGSDGAVALDGTNTYSFFTKSGNNYTATKDIMASTLSISSGVTLIAKGFVINAWAASGAGAGGFNGFNATSATGGVAAITGGYLLGGTTGGAGGTGVGSAGVAQSQQGMAGVGGAGGAGSSGAGGAAGTSVALSAANSTATRPRILPSAATGTFFAGTTVLAFASGSGGGGGGGDGTNSGGGGGGSAGVAIFNLKTITGTLTFTANGGNGFTPTTGNCGGGGGGAGGVVIVNTTAASGQTLTATAGTGGSGVGTGVAGSSGSTGKTFFNVWS